MRRKIPIPTTTSVAAGDPPPPTKAAAARRRYSSRLLCRGQKKKDRNNDVDPNKSGRRRRNTAKGYIHASRCCSPSRGLLGIRIRSYSTLYYWTVIFIIMMNTTMLLISKGHRRTVSQTKAVFVSAWTTKTRTTIRTTPPRRGCCCWTESSPFLLRRYPGSYSTTQQQRVITAAIVTTQQRLWCSTSSSSNNISASDDNNDDDGEKPTDTNKKKTKKKQKKFQVAKTITPDHIDRLAAAFDDLAKKEGFDEKYAQFADDDTFEDDFTELDLDDFYEEQTQRSSSADDNDDVGSMDARIAAAQTGHVSIPRDLETFVDDYTYNIDDDNDFTALGFTREENEEPYFRPPRINVVTNAMVCPACGADFQCKQENRPGYLPPAKFEIQVKLGKIEELQKLQDKALDKNKQHEWTAEDEVEWLIQTADTSSSSNSNINTNRSQDGDNSKDDDTKQKNDVVAAAAPDAAKKIDIEAMADELGLDLPELNKKKIICKRCHGLQNYGKVDDKLRPGWTDEPLLAQERFRELLRPIRDKTAVIVALVDLFDFSGSVLPELDEIAGEENPVILAANKADLLPDKMGRVRAENWVRRELEYMGVKSLANVGGAVQLVSCKTGAGVSAMLDKALALAYERDCDIYVVGAANAGKSTLLNHILLDQQQAEDRFRGKRTRAGNRNRIKGAVTTSALPGTTLKFIRVDLGDGRTLYDTPGLLVPGTLTSLLTPEELKIVVPKNKVEPITFRVAAGKAVLIGGLAKIELIGDCRPFFFTFFVANEIKLHPTDSTKADAYVRRHVGTNMLSPPLAPGPERLEQLGEFESHTVDINGRGWKEAGADIALTGLGWVAVTGVGVATVRITVPQKMAISVRPPLMPFDVIETTAKYTGSRAIRKSGRSKSGKRRKGVGRN